MPLRTTRWIVTATLAVGVAFPPAAGAALRPRVIDSFGVHTLTELGHGPLELSGAEQRAQASIRYALPAGAAQGPENWFLIRLRFELELSAESGSGFAYVSASHDGATSAQVEFETQREGSALTTMWSTVGLVDGTVRSTTQARLIRISFRNYVPYAGVRPGVNTLAFQLEQYEGIRVRRVRIFADSAIEYSRTGPATIEVTAKAEPQEPVVGDRVTLHVTVTNTGDGPARDVTVDAEYDRLSLRLRGEPTPQLAAVPSGETAAATLEFEALEPGLHQVALSAASSSNSAATELRLNVRPRPGGPTSSHDDRDGRDATPFVVGATALILLLVGTLLARRARRKVL